MYKHIFHTAYVSKRAIISLMVCGLSFSMIGCTSCQKGKELFDLQQLDKAKQEAKELADLLKLDTNTPAFGKAVTKWEEQYTLYFFNQQQAMAGKDTANTFLSHSYHVAIATGQIIEQYHTYIQTSNKWHPVLEFRALLNDMLQALVAVLPHLQHELEDAQNDISKIQGGCASGTCPFVSVNYVKAETNKIMRLLKCVNRMLQEIASSSKQVYAIGQEAISIMERCTVLFEEKTRNFNPVYMEAERINLFYGYVQAGVLFTISLKELYVSGLV